MTDRVMTTATEPDGAPRLAGLDILRGVAILGILFMNINDMGASLHASSSDFRHIGWDRGDQVAWFIRAVFAEGTARCLLQMLFGVGMVILTDRAADTLTDNTGGSRLRAVAGWVFGPWSMLKAYYWRNLVLFGFGVIHVLVLLWPGDILHTYGLAALVAFLFRRLGPKPLVAMGLFLATLQLAFGGYSYFTVPGKRAEAVRLERVVEGGGRLTPAQTELLKAVREGRTERAEVRAREARSVVIEDKARTGTFATWVHAQWDSALFIQREGVEIFALLESVTVMLLGAGLFKLGVIQGDRSRRFYVILLIAGYAIGFGSRIFGALVDMRFDGSPSLTWMMYEPGRLATTLGHIALIHLMLRSVFGSRLLRPFEAVGRTALSVYIAQTLICLWLLYPPFALGLYGQQGWLALMLTAVAVNVGLMVVANWYVRHYRIAPVEWAWRSVITGRRLPFRG